MVWVFRNGELVSTNRLFLLQQVLAILMKVAPHGLQQKLPKFDVLEKEKMINCLFLDLMRT
jgi:hypothetical protein